MRMNKRGEEEEGLLANVLGTVLAITATLIIIVGIYLAATQITKDNEVEAAQTTIARIVTRVDLLSNNEAANFTIQGFKTQGDSWYLISWSKNQPNRPDKCFFEACLCICKGDISGTIYSDTYKSHCTEKGICRTFPDIQTVTTQTNDILRSTAGGGNYYTDNPRYIKIQQSLMQITLTKEPNKLAFEHFTEGYYTNKGTPNCPS